jgi:hypothetical protein
LVYSFHYSRNSFKLSKFVETHRNLRKIQTMIFYWKSYKLGDLGVGGLDGLGVLC